MINIWKKFKNWLHSWLNPPLKTLFVEENTPDILNEKTLYVVTEEGSPWHAEMICPCGCGETIHLNLIPDERPVWKLHIHEDGTSTLQPSVWRKTGCKSHFWFRKGRFEWCDS